MALSFSEKVRGGVVGKAFRVVEVTHDGSETSIDASSLDMNYIDYAFNVAATVPLSATSVAWADLTTNSGKYLGMTALSSGAKTTIVAFGS